MKPFSTQSSTSSVASGIVERVASSRIQNFLFGMWLIGQLYLRLGFVESIQAADVAKAVEQLMGW